MKRSVLFLLVLFLIAGFGFTGGQGEKKAAEARPIWVWGVPTWAGEYDEASLAVANEWAMKNFGATFKISSGIPQGSTAMQALNLAMAQGQFPDVIGGFGYGEDTKKLLSEFAAQGKILALDKYFNDPKNFPIFVTADKAYLRAYMYKGKIYGYPTYGWPVTGDTPAYGGPYFYIRLDVKTKYGAPKTLSEMYSLLKQVKADKLTDVQGNPCYPFGILPDPNHWSLNGFLTMTNGGGWELDPQKRLMPKWAAKEFYDGIKYLNTLWREGLMNPGAFIIDVTKFTEDLKSARYAIQIGASWTSGPIYGVIVSLVDKGAQKTDPEVAKLLSMRAIQMDYPNTDNPGLVTAEQTGFCMLSAKNPNPEATMKLFHWLQTDEGLISSHADAGLKDVDWEFVKDPCYWQVKGSTPCDQIVTPEHSAGGWTDSKTAKEKPPRILPVVNYMSTPSYALFYGRIFYHKAGEDRWEQKYGTRYWTDNSSITMKKITTKIPSYSQVIADIPPMEASAMATALQRYNEAMAKVITAATEADFQNEYKNLITTMIGITNWKPIYEAKQKRWLDWLAENKFDDRPQLKSNTPIPEWKAVMGW